MNPAINVGVTRDMTVLPFRVARPPPTAYPLVRPVPPAALTGGALKNYPSGQPGNRLLALSLRMKSGG